ncbi:FAD-binding protein, partial [Mesorhizobium sp. M3A.F.Ca.ET.174.01.1.1]|uniref:FAD-binding oxidoreductase n=1 Tax=Mesorhizobium sp. M3A.F.Ca.ET.174.01.1.1 TaxID=2563944 RepID=UPI001FDEFACC
MSSSAIDELKSAIRGQLVLPEDAGFNEARRIWNAMIDCRPAMILRCAGVADVRRGVAFARAHNLPLALRGGGHNIAGSALCEDGLVMDF